MTGFSTLPAIVMYEDLSVSAQVKPIVPGLLGVENNSGDVKLPLAAVIDQLSSPMAHEAIDR
jgi:hypothetical protein